MPPSSRHISNLRTGLVRIRKSSLSFVTKRLQIWERCHGHPTDRPMDVRSTTRAWSSTTVTHFQEPQPLPPSSNGIDHVLARAHGDPDDPRAHDEVVLRASNLDRKVKAAAVQSKKKAEAEKARRERTIARAVPLRPTSAAARTKPPPPTRKELVQLHERKKMTKELAGELHDMIGVSANANALSKACLVCHEPPYWFMEAPFTHDASSSGREVEACDGRYGRGATRADSAQAP